MKWKTSVYLGNSDRFHVHTMEKVLLKKLNKFYVRESTYASFLKKFVPIYPFHVHKVKKFN